jgi:predicted RNA-binding Zn-ribbon protein involved in translation (DUF1610 family)
MEIFKFNIRPQAEITAREEFTAIEACEGCGKAVKSSLITLKECNELQEKHSCLSCGFEREKSHVLH